MTSMIKKIRVHIVSQYTIVRWGMDKYLSSNIHLDVVGSSSSIADAYRILKKKPADVAIVEVIQFDSKHAKQLNELSQKYKLFLVGFGDVKSWKQVELFFDAGGKALVSAQSSLDDITKAIVAATTNKEWISQNLRRVQFKVERNEQNNVLTKREYEVVSLITNGLTSKQIADQLCLSINTIESHRKRIFKKLGIKNSSQLVRYAMSKGIVCEPTKTN